MTIWSPEKVAELIRLRGEGKSREECAEILNVPFNQIRTQVTRLHKDKGIPKWMEWKPEDNQKLIELYGQGYSSYKIAEVIGKSRNSIIGRIDRLKRTGVLQPRTTAVTNHLKKANQKNGRGFGKQVKSIVRGYFFKAKQRHEYTPAVREAVESLENNNCRYPIGELTDPDFRFCCAPKKAGSAYCEEHHKVCWRPMPNDRRRAKEAFSLKAWGTLASR